MELTSGSAKKRLDWIDVAKGLGILMVLYGHSYGPHNRYIYLFHMPLFFLLSGFLYNPRGSFRDFLIRKVKSLYIPFVGWNILILIGRLIPKLMRGNLTSGIILSTLKKIGGVLLTLDKDGDYLGAIWFLGALFTVSVAYKFLDVFIEEGAYKRLFITALCFIAGISALYITLPYKQSRVLILSMFYALGYLVRLHWEEFRKCFTWAAGAVALILLAWIGMTTRADLGNNEYTSLLLFFFAACLGSFVTVWLARMIDSGKSKLCVYGKRCLSWWGRNSMDILIWQFVMFRLVAAFQFWMEGEPVRRALKERIYITSGGWWITYTAVGILASLLWGWLLRQGFWGKLLKKIYLVR